MITRLLKVCYITAIISLLLLQYASATRADHGTALSRSEYSVPARLEPQVSTDGKTLYNAVPPVIYVVDLNPFRPPLRVQAAFDPLTLPPELATATFSITYVAEGGTDLWGETCYTFPDGAKAALNAAAAIWGNTVQSSVPIAIKACWANLSGGMLGYSGGGPLHSDFTNAPLPNTLYTGALANALAGYDIMPTKWDMHITYSLNFSWYVGTDGNTPPGQFDLVSVALHEMGHGLGFAGSMTYSGGQGSWGFYGMPTIYDTFVRDNSGNQLINTGIYGNPSTALGSALTSNNIYFHGSNAMAANGGQRAKVYAPSTWAEGSSYSHLDYGTFGGTSNRLMVYAITAGDSIHDPGPVTIGLLTDLGWVTSISDCPSGEDTIYVKWDGECAGKRPCYSTIQSAVNAANTCTIINSTGDTYNEDVVLSMPNTLILQGGWDSSFTTIQSNTTISSLGITSGKVTVGNFISE